MTMCHTSFRNAFAEEVESFEIRANACEKLIGDESIAGARNRATDKAVFLALKTSPQLQEDKNLLNDHDLNVMIYRLVDDYVQDLTSKVTKSEEDKVCVEISGFINPQSISHINGRPISVELPLQVICTVVETEPVIKGQTAASSYKPAILDNGVRIMVPPFIGVGEKIVVGTTEVNYVERAK